jgi:hypothetical protein
MGGYSWRVRCFGIDGLVGRMGGKVGVGGMGS